MRIFLLLNAAIAVAATLGDISAVAERADDDIDENGFISLFNGVDLTGWTGDISGHCVEDGILAVNPQGNLYTEAEYNDFVLRFQFKLTPGANNGIGIRVPMNGKASRDGIEIQILDDSSPKFAEAKPYQRHGSVYGIIPAKTGHLKPVGEWNEEEIRIQGMRVCVVLNGAVIVDANLTPFRDGAPTPDGKEHKGLQRERGHISLAGHKTRIFFRNLRLKPIEPSTRSH
jgi:hypothetical protein